MDCRALSVHVVFCAFFIVHSALWAVFRLRYQPKHFLQDPWILHQTLQLREVEPASRGHAGDLHLGLAPFPEEERRVAVGELYPSPVIPFLILFRFEKFFTNFF